MYQYPYQKHSFRHCVTGMCAVKRDHVAGIVNEDKCETTGEFEINCRVLAELLSLHIVNQLGIRIKIHLRFV